MEHFLDAFRNFANFSGRATRKQYWMFILFYIIFYVILAAIDGVMGTVLLSSIFSLVMLIPSLSYAARRLHDTDRTGWWQLIALIPIVGAIVLIVFLAQQSTDGQRFGEPVNA
jgi:uncharacterized membrane protein YhaH (DUF805 family)